MNYKTLRLTNIIFHGIEVPLGVYSGIMLATNQPMMFAVGMIILSVTATVGAWIYWLTMEKME